MSRYLVFQLYAPLLSWGEAAVGEVRHSNTVPSRSALLGLLGAACGIRRDDPNLNEFNQHYLFAIRSLSSREQWLRDYHTVEVPKENRKRAYFTRRDELTQAPDELGTMITTREYRCDAYYHIAVQETEGAPLTLEQLAAALTQPVFPLYLGRKSCPPALPLEPVILEGTLGQVFRQAEQTLIAAELAAMVEPSDGCHWEGEQEGVLLQIASQRSDRPLSKVRWQFTTRTQFSGLLMEEK